MNPLHIYKKLLKHFGKQYWWPAKTKFEVIIGAILTQQTNWKNAELAIENLKDKGLLNPHLLAGAPLSRVEELIRQSGFYKQKARRIIGFSQYLVANYDGSLSKFFSRLQDQIRKELLSLEGIGPETADSILLYAADRLCFPIDAYTMRLCERLGKKETQYEKLTEFFKSNLPRDLETYKEFHALIDELGKTYCKTKPVCSTCPLRSKCVFSSKNEADSYYNAGNKNP
jgi:endonuclease-3 related protein